METQTNYLTEIYDTIKNSKNISESEMLNVINGIYLKTVEEITTKFTSSDKTVEDVENLSDLTIDTIFILTLTTIRYYSLDISDAEYKVPEEKIRTIKKHFAKALLSNNLLHNNILSSLFLGSYLTSLKKATGYRELVLKQKSNTSN